VKTLFSSHRTSKSLDPFDLTLQVQNEVVFWDRIIRRKEDAVIAVSGKNKYPFRELSAKFKGSGPANYTLKYNLMPFVGVLTYGEAARVTKPIEFPLARDRVE
jgi:signal peptidase complex subunit 3